MNEEAIKKISSLNLVLSLKKKNDHSETKIVVKIPEEYLDSKKPVIELKQFEFHDKTPGLMTGPVFMG